MSLISRLLGVTALCAASLLATVRAASMEVGSAGDLELNDTSRHKTLQVRVSYPEADGTFPLIVFSHGAWSTKDEYQPLVRHWASQGYVVLQVNHADSTALGGRQSADSFKGWADRVRDISVLIDQLDQIEAAVPDVHGRIDRKHIGVAGHSFGGQTTQLIAGYRIGGSQSYRDDRVSAVVLLSPPGGVPNDSPQSWADIRIPMLTIVGSADTSMRTGGDYKWRLDAYRNSGSSDNYAIVVDGAEHLLGGISETRQGGKPVPRVSEQLTLVLDATTDFWNAYLKNDSAARNALASGEVVSANAAAASFESKSGTARTSEGASASVAKSTASAAGATPAASAGKQVDLGPTLPYDVEKLEWRDEKRDRPIPVKIFAPIAPASPGKLPTIVFSHGYGESRDSFEYLGQYWARHGYIVVFITHEGSDREHLNTKGLPRGDIENTFDPRPLDIRYVTDRLAQSDPGSKLLRGRVDLDRLAIAGQCMGSTTALYMVGLQIQRDDGSHYSDPDPRFKVAVALSPQMPRSLMLQGARAGSGTGGTFGQGSQRELYSGSWEKINVPTLVVTGTLDYTLFPSVRKNPDLRHMAYDGLPSGDKYLVDIVGAEHDAFTDSDPWYPSGPRDPRHHDWIGEATTGSSMRISRMTQSCSPGSRTTA
jgi:predicted dienelactone hydrolase